MVFYNHIRYRSRALGMKRRANGRNIVGCYILRLFTHPVANLRKGPSLAVLMHSLLRHPLQAKRKQSLISGYPVACSCVLLGIVA